MASQPGTDPFRLHAAIRFTQTSRIKEYILAGDSIDAADTEGMTPTSG